MFSSIVDFSSFVIKMYQKGDMLVFFFFLSFSHRSLGSPFKVLSKKEMH